MKPRNPLCPTACEAETMFSALNKAIPPHLMHLKKQLSFSHRSRLLCKEPYTSLELGHLAASSHPKSPINTAVFRVADTSKVLRIKG